MSEINVNEVELNGIKYVRKDSISQNQTAESLDGMPYVIVRTYSAGVHAGYLKKREGKEVELLHARRLWYWDGAASLSQLSQEGTKKPGSCKFPCEVSRIELMEAIEIAEMVAMPQFIEVKLILNRCMDTSKDKCKIQRIDYQAYQQIKHSEDKPIDFILQISNWGTINCYSDGELGNNTKHIHVTHYLLKQGFDLFGLIESGLAIDKTLNI